jgi:cell division protein FtsQ
VWEDDVPAEPRLRRVQQGVSPSGRGLPGMPLEMEEAEDDVTSPVAGARFGKSRFERARNPLAGTAGRIFLLLAALALLGGLAASAYLLKSYMERDARFRITGTSNIEATGLTEVSRAEMLPVFGEDIGRNIFFVPLGERQRQLEEIPWIERATVIRLLPDRIRVSVVERKPVAFVRQGQQIGMVDANGVLLTMPAAMMAQQHYSFPVVAGIDPRDTPASRQERMAVYRRLLAELDSTGGKFSEQISEIDLTDPEDAKVLMPEPGGDVLAHFGQDHFLERYQRYAAHIAEWRQQYPKLMAVDLRYAQQVVLQMAPGGNAAQAASNEQNAAGGNAAQDKPSTAKPVEAALGTTEASKERLSSAGPKAGQRDGRTSTKLRTAREKALLRAHTIAQARARQRKRAAEARGAALDISKRKSAPTARPASSAGLGQ